MTTKAFTSALGYGITVRGYIDEDDKLVLLEPEGSGGGGGDSDFTTATLEVAGQASAVPVIAPHIVDDQDAAASFGFIDNAGSYNVILYKGSCFIMVRNVSESYEVTVSGDAEILSSEAGTYIILITGNSGIMIGVK